MHVQIDLTLGSYMTDTHITLCKILLWQNHLQVPVLEELLSKDVWTLEKLWHPNSPGEYKNCLQLDAGIHDMILEWMKQESDNQGLTDEQRIGGVVFDEMAIQVGQKND